MKRVDVRTELLALFSASDVDMRKISVRTGISVCQIGRAVRGRQDALSIEELGRVRSALHDVIRASVTEQSAPAGAGVYK